MNLLLSLLFFISVVYFVQPLSNPYADLRQLDSDKIMLQLMHINDTDEFTVLTNRNIHKINIELPVIIVIHGWTDNSNKRWLHEIAKEHINRAPVNAIVTDWSSYSLQQYGSSVRNTKFVGHVVGMYIIEMICKGVRPSKVHIIGHSLGAHVAGIAGKTVMSKLGVKVGRITGLDPAAPLFEYPFLRDKKYRLTEDDAKFVDIIHTCVGKLGFLRPIGHVDFYPNGGFSPQPGCGSLNLFKTDTCSHLKSYAFYTASINEKKFWAKKCPGILLYQFDLCDDEPSLRMGLDTPKTARGIYFIDIDEI